jgi:hypothetical protein
MKGFLIMTCLIASILARGSVMPKMQFPEGNYLGEGKYMVSNGAVGNYASFLDLNSSEWRLHYLRHGQPYLYTVSLEFFTLGFFDAYINKIDDQDFVETHFYFDLGDRYIEETIMLIPEKNKIERLGSLRYFDENDEEQTVAWNEVLMRIDNDDLALGNDYLPPWSRMGAGLDNF